MDQQMMCATPDCRRAVMDIVVWLRSMGLGKYEAAFRENEIDETVLPSLTHETLKELSPSLSSHTTTKVRKTLHSNSSDGASDRRPRSRREQQRHRLCRGQQADDLEDADVS